MNTSKTELTALKVHVATSRWSDTTREQNSRYLNFRSEKEICGVALTETKRNVTQVAADSTGKYLHSKGIARQVHLTTLYRLRKLHTLTAISNGQTAGLPIKAAVSVCLHEQQN
jgi:hypothetical protein